MLSQPCTPTSEIDQTASGGIETATVTANLEERVTTIETATIEMGGETTETAIVIETESETDHATTTDSTSGEMIEAAHRAATVHLAGLTRGVVVRMGMVWVVAILVAAGTMMA